MCEDFCPRAGDEEGAGTWRFFSAGWVWDGGAVLETFLRGLGTGMGRGLS